MYGLHAGKALLGNIEFCAISMCIVNSLYKIDYFLWNLYNQLEILLMSILTPPAYTYSISMCFKSVMH